ncbi:VOC family protein [Myxacorys almedinensis]|uniref:VOC family protein n=1 Tax=Myxacorys almedinensis A TaxID=2690445 RepID=A0A8J8CJS9_9CYAN|nr:VOC family protein [Myxacorys almedinensis]NDJ19308.1 VOC family protein [Myxacorys almedinensis A]
MPSAPILKKVCPFIPSGEDLSATIAFYEQKLGFKKQWQDSDHPELALISRDEIEIFLQKNPDPAIAEWTLLRIEVNGIAALYQEYLSLSGFGEGGRSLIHPDGALERKAWGSQEFSVLDPNGVCITFYEFLAMP